MTVDELVLENEVEISPEVPASQKDYLQALKEGEKEIASLLYAELNPQYS